MFSQIALPHSIKNVVEGDVMGSIPARWVCDLTIIIKKSYSCYLTNIKILILHYYLHLMLFAVVANIPYS